MALIRANRESIDDRFSVLGFTVRTDTPLFEIGLATDPALLLAENRARRTRGNFFSSTLLGATRKRDGETIYLVPPSVVARFAGQQRLYFGLATYQDGNRAMPVEVRIPDRGNMYVNLAGLTERGLRRTARGEGTASYGNGGGESMQWGADALTTRSNGTAARAGNGNGHAAAPSASGDPAPYSDGYSDDLWKQPAATPATAPTVTAAPAPSVTAAPAPVADTAPAPSDTSSLAPVLAPTQAPVAAQSWQQGTQRTRATPPLPARPLARPLLVGPYYRPEDWWGALTTQVAHFARGAMWFLGVPDTTQPPFSAICQVRIPDATEEGAHQGTAFFIGPRLLLTAAHVVDGQSELIIVPGKNGGGINATTEPFGRFRVSTFQKHPQYPNQGHDHDMALICVPPEHAVQGANYFNLVEELTQSRPEGVIVSGYAAWWHAVNAIEQYVNANIDENRQHAHGGYIREIPTDGTFTYDLQTLAGTSGSPVYWIEDGSAPQAHLVGVHVAANDDRTNKGCRVTPEKLRWIRDTAAAWGQTLTFSLGVRALEAPVDEDEEDPEIYGIGEGEPDYVEAATTQSVRALAATSPDYPGASRFAPAHANNFRVGRRRNAAVDRIVIHITAGGPNINGTISWFQNGSRINARTGKPIRSSSHYVVGRDGEVVQMVRNADTAWHASAVNPRSIGIEHNANKPSRGNKRDLPPTDPQYEASARLVAWLCQQYGLPIDREHIVGHMEASPRDNHDCPSDYWDWDRYMACVQLASSQLASGQGFAGAQNFGAYGAIRAQAPGPVSKGLEIISPFYDPADPTTALSCQDDAFSLAREEWFVGVPNTSLFPHSAICQLNMTAPDGSQYGGTGFYIGRNRILTCAHNLHGMSRCEIIPGRNGAGSRPFGSATVQSASWRVAPRYSGSGDWDNDLAVIDNVPIAAPGNAWFEFLNATPSDRLPIVVCGYSAASRKVPQLDVIIDGDKQHLHGGYVSAQPTFDTIDYPILSLMGASGSPVYTLTRASGTLKAAICAVHVSGEPADQGLNRGCFITPTKIDWIEGRATTFALNARGLSDESDDDARGIEGPIPDDTTPARSRDAFGTALTAPSPEYPQASRFVPAATGNYRANANPRTIDRVVIHITDGGANINGTIGWFQNPAAQVSAHYVIGQDGEVVQMVRHQDVAWHAGRANRGTIGIEHVANTRGLRPTPAQMCASAALVTWLCDTYSIPVDRTHILGHSEADTGTSHTGCPNAVWDWNYYMGLVTSRTCYAPESTGTTTAQALAGGSDYPVHLIPQPDKNACWAASMAMLLSFRRNQSLTPETLANDVGASLATCYNWDLLKAVRDRYGFEILRQPDNASIYHSPSQWADWLTSYGPLWVVIVGAPHAVVLAGIKGNLDDPSSVQVKILNPWDTRVGFDNDPVSFNPPNQGYEDWLSFEQFASDFGNMAESNYGNWRVLHLPVAAVNAQSLGQGGFALKRAPAARMLSLGEQPTSGESREPIEPSRVTGTRMHVLRGSAGACRWALDQLEGMKEPGVPNPGASSNTPAETTVDLTDWPALDGAVCPLPLNLVFRAQRGCVGDVRIRAGTTSHLAYGVDATARIDDYTDLSGVAALRVTIDYRFSGLAEGEPAARIQLRLLGDGRYERENGWVESGGIQQAA